MSEKVARIVLLTVGVLILLGGIWFLFLKTDNTDKSKVMVNEYAGSLPPGAVMSAFRTNGFFMIAMTPNENKDTFGSRDGFGIKNDETKKIVGAANAKSKASCFIAKNNDIQKAKEVADKLKDATPKPDSVDQHGNFVCAIHYGKKDVKEVAIVYERAVGTLTTFYDRSKANNKQQKDTKK